MTVWINPAQHEDELQNSKPVIVFARISHSPYLIVPKVTVCRHRVVGGGRTLSDTQRIEWNLARRFFDPRGSP
ncbi:MAG: hypothetical protein ACM3X1_02840, partial [Ignavibacteriales bacterium]